MMIGLLERLPGPARAGADVLAVAGWVSALAGALTQIFGLLAAVLSFTWMAMRFYHLFTRKRRCVNAGPGCPAVCPQDCPQYKYKSLRGARR